MVSNELEGSVWSDLGDGIDIVTAQQDAEVYEL